MPDAPGKTWIRYSQRVDAVIAYIHAHLADPLNSDTLAEVAHLSPYHWHRIYKAVTGESAMTTVKRSRMHKAAAELLRTDLSIQAIGQSVGYPRLHSFNRTFKAYYGMAPGQFRHANSRNTDSAISTSAFNPARYQVTLDTKPDMHLIGLWHQGDFMEIGRTFEAVMAQCSIHGLIETEPVTAGVYYSDPEVTGVDALRSFAGVSVAADINPPDELQKIIYPGGRFASMIHTGPYALLNQSYHWLFGCWLPASNEAVKDQPCCEIYLNAPVQTDPSELRTAICLPIQS